MKKLIIVLSTVIISMGVFAACSSDEHDAESATDLNEQGNNEPENENEDGADGKAAGESDESMENSSEGPVSAGEYENQTDLRLGDTGQIATTIEEFEVTFESARAEDEVDGEVSMFDFFIITDLTIKNIGDSTLDVADAIGALEMTNNLDGSGAGDYSREFESIDGLSGELAPGEEASGEAIFDTRTGDTQYIRVRSGLVAAGAVKNEATWTIDMDEVE